MFEETPKIGCSTPEASRAIRATSRPNALEFAAGQSEASQPFYETLGLFSG
jgi:hypothetical protein